MRQSAVNGKASFHCWITFFFFFFFFHLRRSVDETQLRIKPVYLTLWVKSSRVWAAVQVRTTVVCLLEAAYGRCSTSSFEGTREMRKPFYCFTVAFVRRLRKPLSQTNRTLEGPNLFCLGLSLCFCLMNKSTFLHTPTPPCKSKRRVQVWVCYRFNKFRDDARTVFLSSVQNMDKQAEQRWKIRPESKPQCNRGGRRTRYFSQSIAQGRNTLTFKAVLK